MLNWSAIKRRILIGSLSRTAHESILRFQLTPQNKQLLLSITLFTLVNCSQKRHEKRKQMLSLLRIDRVDASTYNQIKKSHYNKYFIDLACSPATAASRNDALFWRKFYFKGGRVFHRKPCKSCKLAIPLGPPPSRSFAHMRSKTCCSTTRLRVVGHAEKCIRLSPRKLKCCMF